MITPITEKLIKQFKKASLTLEDKNALLSAIQNKLMVLPLNDSIISRPGMIIINGKQLELDQMVSFTESCKVLKDNFAHKIFKEQVKYLALNMGIVKSVSLDELFFAKSALWYIDNEEKLIDSIVD